MKKIKLSLLIILASGLGLIVASYLQPSKAYADSGWLKLDRGGYEIDVEFTWVDRATIDFKIKNAIKHSDDGLSDDSKEIIESQGEGALLRNIQKVHNGQYVHKDLLRDDSGGFRYEKDYCGSTKQLIQVDGLFWNTGNNKALIDQKSLNVEDGECGDLLYTQDMHENYLTDGSINIGNEANRDIWFKIVDDQTLERVDNKEKFTRGDENNANKYLGPKVGGCRQRVDLDEPSRKGPDLLVLGGFETCDTDRGYIKNIRAKRDKAETGKTDEVKNKDVGDLNDDGTGTAEAPDISCEVTLTNPLTWVACPLIEAAQFAVQQFDNAITNRLTIDTNTVFNTKTETGQGFYAAWSTFRYLAMIMLVIIGLVMVISQATGASIVDAYTIKKVMPRIFIAVIAITLSWNLMEFAINFSNDLGIGVRSLMYAPFSGLQSAQVSDGAASLLAVAGGAGLASLGMLGVLSFGLTALLAVLIGFGVIIFREMLIALLVVTVPVAIICWILPNTQKVWKMWSDFFVKALLAFPIITMMIATGHIFSKIVVGVNQGTQSGAQAGQVGILETSIAFICYFGPYFMIPTAFKLAGGAIATVSGAVGDKSRGGFDRLKNYRKGQRDSNARALKEGTRYQGRSYIPGSQRAAARFGKISHGASLGVGNQFGLGERGKLASDASLATMADEKMKTKEWQGHMYKDDVMRALTYSDGEQAKAGLKEYFAKQGLSGKALDDRVNSTMIAANQIGFGRTSQVAAASQMAMNKSAFDDAADAMETVQRVGGKNANLESSVREKVKFINKGVGRNDGGALEGMNDEELRQARSGDIEGARQAWNDRLTIAGAKTADAATLARNHKKGLDNIAAATQRSLQRNQIGSEQHTEAAKVAASLEDSKSWATLGNKDNIHDTSEVARSQTTGTKSEPTGRKFLEDEVVEGRKTGRQVITPETVEKSKSVLDDYSDRPIGYNPDQDPSRQQNTNPNDEH